MVIEAVPRDGDAPAPFLLRTAAGSRRRRDRWRAVPAVLSRGDRLALTVFVVLPILLYVPFSLAGHPVLPGDNLTQNFPLRVLAGEQLGNGHLPTWDPLVWSGTPLLAGWNGGSMFPATWLFAVLPGVAAWTVAYTATPIVAAVGAFALLRLLGTRPTAATFGALAFTYTGFMNGQVVHLGLVQGTALMPWTLAGIELVRRRVEKGGSPARLAAPGLVVAVAAGLTVLAGDPRAVTTTAIAAGIYVLALLVRGARHPLRLVATVAGAGVLAALLSAIQWLPGLHFVHGSQRGSTAYGFFGAGSLTLGHVASFLLAPFLFGGNGNLGQPTYGGFYNLPELTIGTGVLATVAFMAYLPALVAPLADRFPAAGRLARRVARRLDGLRRPPSSPQPAARRQPRHVGHGREVGVWYATAVVGLLLTLGTTTPLGHLLVHIPLFDGERLQNRNAALIDLALVVLVAFLLDDLLERRGTGLLGSWRAKLLCLVPLGATAGLVLLAYADPAAMRSFDGVSPTNTGLFVGMLPDNLWQLALVAGATALVLRPTALAHRRGRRLLALLAVADLGLFVANLSFSGMPTSVLSGSSTASRTLARLTGGGRMTLYDPINQSPDEGPLLLDELGAPDLNIVAGVASVQGYGSVVASAYDQATSTHGYENLRVASLTGSTFDTLDLRTLLTLPNAFATPLAPGAPPPTPGTAVPGAASSAAAVGTPAAVVGGPYRVAPGSGVTFLLPAPSTVRRVELVVAGGGARDGRSTVSVMLGTGTHAGRPVRAVGAGGTAVARFPAGRPVLTVRVRDLGARPVVLDAVVADTPGPTGRLALDGPLQGRILGGHWRYAATIGSFVAWRNLHAPGPAWLQPVGARAADPARRAPGRVAATTTATGRDEMTVASPRPALLVRSEAYAVGWTAQLTPLGGGTTRLVRVRPMGIIQAVPVPAGAYTVTWRYAPPTVHAGLLASAAGAAGLVAIAALALVTRRRRRARSGAGVAATGRHEAVPQP